MSTEDHYSLVTGASSGLGACFAEALAGRGRNLVITARSAPRLEALAQDLRERFGVRVLVHPADLSLAGAVQELFEFCEANGATPDLVVNNAGSGIIGDFIDSPAEDTVRMIELNVVAATLVALLSVQAMRAAGLRGTVLNVASTASFQPVPGMAVYAATKSYLLSLSEATGQELRKHGIRMLALCPGPTRTEFFERAGFDVGHVRFKMQTAAEVVAAALRAIDRGRSVTIPGWLNRLGARSAPFGPRSLVLRIAEWSMRR